MKKIILELHKTDNVMLLDWKDLTLYFSELVAEERKLLHFLMEYCDFLNWHFDLHNKDMLVGDCIYEYKRGWLQGYSVAKDYKISILEDRTEIKTKNQLIILKMPYEMKNEVTENENTI